MGGDTLGISVGLEVICIRTCHHSGKQFFFFLIVAFYSRRWKEGKCGDMYLSTQNKQIPTEVIARNVFL